MGRSEIISLTKYSSTIENIFDLIGHDEKGMTTSLGWMFKHNPIFLKEFGEFFGLDINIEDTHVFLEKPIDFKRTDIEIKVGNEIHIIIEAKKGLIVPTKKQLKLYSNRFNENDITKKLFIVVSNDDPNDIWLDHHYNKDIAGIPVKSISWEKIQKLAIDVKDNHSRALRQKYMLEYFVEYLSRLVTMRNINSNRVKIFTLNDKIHFPANKTSHGKDIRLSDVVTEFKKYFHPIGGGSNYPKIPSNYLGFRYGISGDVSRLRSLHHVQKYEIMNDYKMHFPLESSYTTDRPYYIYTLGPNIIKSEIGIPLNDVNKNYKDVPRQNSVIAHLDLLLTCDSIAEAVFKTKERQSATNGQNG